MLHTNLQVFYSVIIITLFLLYFRKTRFRNYSKIWAVSPRRTKLWGNNYWRLNSEYQSISSTSITSTICKKKTGCSGHLSLQGESKRSWPGLVTFFTFFFIHFAKWVPWLKIYITLRNDQFLSFFFLSNKQERVLVKYITQSFLSVICLFW